MSHVLVSHRVSTVEHVKGHKPIKGRKPITLAIGDGANDVAMIREVRAVAPVKHQRTLRLASTHLFTLTRRLTLEWGCLARRAVKQPAARTVLNLGDTKPCLNLGCCCSDYSIGQFQFLRRLLLIHGHYCYWRIAYTVQFFFYKNLSYILPCLYFGVSGNWKLVSIVSFYSPPLSLLAGLSLLSPDHL